MGQTAVLGGFEAKNPEITAGSCYWKLDKDLGGKHCGESSKGTHVQEKIKDGADKAEMLIPKENDRCESRDPTL